MCWDSNRGLVRSCRVVTQCTRVERCTPYPPRRTVSCLKWLNMQFGMRRTRRMLKRTPSLNLLLSCVPHFHQCFLVICPQKKLKVLCGSLPLGPMGVFLLWYVTPGTDPGRIVEKHSHLCLPSLKTAQQGRAHIWPLCKRKERDGSLW